MDLPPTSPVAEPQWLRPGRQLRLVRRLQAAALTVGVTVVLTAAAGLTGGPLAALSGLLLGAVVVGLGFRAADRSYAAWGYSERGEDFLVRRGVLTRRLSVVPYGRMQFVDVTAGPLARRLGVATVFLHTAAAATDAYVPGLPTAEAHRLRDRLAALGESRAAGL